MGVKNGGYSGFSGPNKAPQAFATPRDSTLKKLRAALEARGVEFLEGEGVRRRAPEIEVFEGLERFHDFTDFVHAHLAMYGGEVCLAAGDERLFKQYRGNDTRHRERMKALVDSGKVSVRIIAAESKWKSTFAQYRFAPALSVRP